MGRSKTIETLLLVMVLVFLMGACASKKKSEDANTSMEQNTTVTDANATAGGNDDDDDDTTTPTLTLKSLKLTADKTSLNKDENTTVKVTATYSDNTTKDVTDKVAWIADLADAVKITAHTLKALQDKPVQLRAKLGGKRSNEIGLTIYWEGNGHRLPPEPDPKVNNATLLGVDVNHNGVRDDVERWIYKTYKDKHPIHIDIAMQAGRAYKKVLEIPERAKEIRLSVNGAFFCNTYYRYDVEDLGKTVLVHERIDPLVKNRYFNTKERKDVYWQYDTLLSGGSYTLPRMKERKALCDFNTSKYDKE